MRMRTVACHCTFDFILFFTLGVLLIKIPGIPEVQQCTTFVQGVIAKPTVSVSPSREDVLPLGHRADHHCSAPSGS